MSIQFVASALLCIYLAPLWIYGASNIGHMDVDTERKIEEGKEKEKGGGEGKGKVEREKEGKGGTERGRERKKGERKKVYTCLK